MKSLESLLPMKGLSFLSIFLKGLTEEEFKKTMKFASAWIRALVFEIMEFKS